MTAYISDKTNISEISKIVLEHNYSLDEYEYIKTIPERQ